jgi:osmotically-inducible protein OsmY
MKIRKNAVILGLVLSAGISISAFAQNADNTAVNKRDRNAANPTAQDGSNRKSAIKSTAKLRRKIVACKGLSSDAKNIKIIDENGCVTLRGPVNTLHEKETIESLTKEVFGENFKNELEVKQ